MFTGIVEEIGVVKSVIKNKSKFRLTIEAKKIMSDIKLGDSIAVNGICLTAENISSTSFTADVMSETIDRSTLKSIKQGEKVNLERAMSANGRFGGHIVSGHIDGVGIITSREKDGNAIWLTVIATQEILKYIVHKGSIAIDGISLTIAYVDSECFKVSVIPHTMSQTILLEKMEGGNVNLECDVIGKYVEKFIGIDDYSISSAQYSSVNFKSDGNLEKHYSRNNRTNNSTIDIDFLRRNGF